MRNGARIGHGSAIHHDDVHMGMKQLAAYVDDGSSGCVAGKNTRLGVEYPCVGSTFDIVP